MEEEIKLTFANRVADGWFILFRITAGWEFN